VREEIEISRLERYGIPSFSICLIPAAPVDNRLAIELSARRSREVVAASIHDPARESGIIAVANIARMVATTMFALQPS